MNLKKRILIYLVLITLTVVTINAYLHSIGYSIDHKQSVNIAGGALWICVFLELVYQIFSDRKTIKV